MDKIILWRSDAGPQYYSEGDYADDGNGVPWLFTRYGQSLCIPGCEDDDCYDIHPVECEVCEEYILDMDHFLCLDGGESAHDDCVIIHSTYPHSTGTLHDCPACDMAD